jgi:mannose-6-phosphate isomerase-like protein (cupin superfamily)
MARPSASASKSAATKPLKSKVVTSKSTSAPAKTGKAVKTSVQKAVKKPSKSGTSKTALSAIKPLKIPKTTRWTPQEFMVQHLKSGKFKTGLRSYAAYRDLGVHQATDGAVQAHVIRLLGACDPDVVSIRHLHGVQFQFLYMLKGWMIGEYNGRRVKMEEGSCWIQPNSIPHTVLDYSENCEMIELILPGTFKTVEL